MEVYRIYNKINNKSYIGITRWSFKDSYRGGRWDLWTHSIHLKSSVVRYGLKNFDYETLWVGEASVKELISLEKTYIQQYNSKVPYGYNLTVGGGSENPSFIKEYELIDFDGNIYQVRNLSAFCHKNKLNYSAMLNMVSGINTSSQGYSLSTTDLKKVKNPKKVYFLENIKTKELAEIIRGGVNKWSKEMNLKPSGIEMICAGSVKVSQGWKLVSTKLEDCRKIINPVKLRTPNGEVVEIKSIFKFCKENNLDRGAFYKLIKGKALEVKGYTLAEKTLDEIKKEKSKRMGRKATLINPSGKEVKIKNVSEFCRKNNLKIQGIFGIISGRTKTSQGWRLKK